MKRIAFHVSVLLMSLPTQQPYHGQQQGRAASPALRGLLAFLVLVVAVGGLYLLGLNYKRTLANSDSAAVFGPIATASSLPQGGTARGTLVPSIAEPTMALTATTALPGTATPPQVQNPAEGALLMLDQAQVPKRDLYSLTARLKTKSTAPIARTTDRPAGDYKAGQSTVFYMSDVVARHYYTVTATIHEVTDHAYWYAQNGSSVDEDALKKVVNLFEKSIYPKNRSLFGSEWSPGVDNDPRITVLFGPISGAGGYFSSADEYTRSINPFSNEREMIYINTDGGWGGVESTLAHEYQHMIHWHEHPNHDVWLNEGASVLASALNGYGVGVDVDFMQNPDVQLNAWRSTPSEALANYGASFLFLDYLRIHYGNEKIIRSVVSAQGQGNDAIDNALSGLGYKERFADVFKQWSVANLVDEQPNADKTQWSYPDRDVKVTPSVVLDSYPRSYSGQVSQFGSDYIELQPAEGKSSLHVDFSGQKETRVIAAPSHSGSHIWWSNRGDLSDMTMTRRFDLRGHATATLDYYVWFDIEEDMDYGYVEVSTDAGATWDSLKGAYTRGNNPNGTNFGNGYTGKSADTKGADGDGWLKESIDLSAYGGKEVMVRFEYVTDDGYNAQGLAVDDISVPELGYKDDGEGDMGWEGAGFVRVYNGLPQKYYLAAVKFKDDGFEVQPVEVGPSGKVSFDVEGLDAKGGYKRVVLVIAGMTPHNLQRVAYELDVQP